MSEMQLMAEHFVIIGQGRLIEDISAEELRAMASGKTTTVRSAQLGDLVGLMRADGVEIISTDRETVNVSGLDATEIGLIARDAGIALTSLVPEQRSLEDVFMSLTADSVQYHGGLSTELAA